MSAQEPNTPVRPRISWSRFILCMALLLLFLLTDRPFNLANTILFIVALLTVNIFQPIYEYVDHVGLWLGHLLKPWWIRMVRPVSNRLLLGVKWLHQRLGRLYTLLVTLLLVGIILSLVAKNMLAAANASLNDWVCVHTQFAPLHYCDTGIGMVSLGTQEQETINIGLITSDQQGPFDHSIYNESESKVEHRIFQEDSSACTASHITLAVVTMLSRTLDDSSISANVGLEDLRGAYLAQHEYNIVPAHHIKLCLIIANLGTRLTTEDALPQVFKKIVLYAKYDPTFRGILGFPFSQAARDATQLRDSWQQTTLPIVSPSAMTDELNNETNFYRVVSSNQQQSQDITAFFVHEFQTTQKSAPVKVAVFVDDSDAYSQNLANDFVKATRAQPVNISTFFEGYQVENPTSLQSGVQDAIIRQNADAIFFAGYAYDVDTLEAQLQVVQQQLKTQKNMPILGGEGIYGLDRYIANSSSSIVYSAVYASPVGINDPFTQQYTQTFGPMLTSSSAHASYSLLPPHAILSYEATSAYLQTLNDIALHKKTLTQDDINQTLATVSFNGPSFNGQADTISFQGKNSASQERSNPPNRADYVMCTDKNHTLQLAAKFLPGQSPAYLLNNVAQCA